MCRVKEGREMARIGDKGTDVLTLVHKLVGLAWVIAVAAMLVFVWPGLSSKAVEWTRLATLARVASTASVATLVLALLYGLASVWGFFGSRWLLAKWALYLVAVSASGYAVRATREETTGTLAALAAVQLVSLLVSMVVGVHLERARHAGKLPHGRP